MIQVDIRLKNFRAKNIETFEILKGENAVLDAEVGNQDVEWFSNNDAVLGLDVSEVNPDGRALVNLMAQKEGTSKVQIQRDGQIIKTLFVTVYAVEANSLNPQAGQPVLKDTL